MDAPNKHINPNIRTKISPKKDYDLPQLVADIKAQNRYAISHAITLVESELDSDKQKAQALLAKLDATNKAFRIVITGAPGVGKSSLINSLGLLIANEGKSLGILTTDPSSSLTKGSILGDKTRMPELLDFENVYIRPSASANYLGGVTKNSLEQLDILNAAAFDYVIMETVGVGQSEFNAYNLSDLFILMINPGAGDELQGMKRGIVEMADMICINKYDGENKALAENTKKQYSNASRLLHCPRAEWNTSTHLISAIEQTGLSELWEAIKSYYKDRSSKGLIERSRMEQNSLLLEEKANAFLLDLINQKSNYKSLISQSQKELANPNKTLSQIIYSLREELEKIL